MLQSIAFYLFAAMTLVSAFQVITARNPVHSVLFLFRKIPKMPMVKSVPARIR